ncbi:MAG: hypothetical protein ACRD24_04025 [Terriglobales bacterium]
MPAIRAAVMVAPHQPVEVREFPEPELERNSVLLAVLRNGRAPEPRET